ncbi:DUF1761 domain-containing protein [Flavobacterium silvisoli]|uniref:DUF1761 domain-containing protein n=1 Tax=Flavobacterium silvisoli TaxID=2529433 RepID=A0A4Q9Z019_9FLAO|nr:DUF1761 domain-containing protein [Flavobacterium silvisoli]TBX69606.1 DUF1761 domain-containing protein [Flavobacterium silvisoli]
MNVNFLALLLASLSTLVVGFIWYNPKVFGTIWMKETGLTPEDGKDFNMIKIFGLSIVYAFLISFVLQMVTIHQFGALGMVGGDPSKALPSYNAFMADYGTAYRTFKHGAFHGFMTGLLMIFPVIGTGALYEQKSFKYVMVTSGFWIVCFTIMGGIICMMQ